MTHPSFRAASPSAPPSADALALDCALDDWVRGDTTALDALDPEMGETVAQLYAWADVAGVPDEPAGVENPIASFHSQPQAASMPSASPRSPRRLEIIGVPDPFDRRTMSRRTRIMTAFSGLAAALVLGLSIYGAVPLITEHQADHPTPSEIAFQAGTPATPDATASASSHEAPPDLIFQGGDPLYAGGDQTVLPPVGTELTGAWGVDTLNPVRPEECSVTPMPREDAVTILSTPPSSDQAPTNQDSTVDETTVSQIQASFRQWQACRRSGNTFGAMALETDAFIRADFYDDGGAMRLGYLHIDQPYSEEASNALLDGRISIDEQRKAISDKQAAGNPGAEDGLDLNLWIIDMQSIGADNLQEQKQFPAAENGTYVWATAIWTNPNVSSDQPFPTVTVNFQLVDGVWKIAYWYVIGSYPPAGV
ncbi:MAG: hypothetical protein QM589_18185 [Thermomicrobiales bacterium]